MLPDVPHNLRANWASAFVQVTTAVEDAIASGSDQERDDALKWRLILPQLLLRKKPQDVMRGRDYVARRSRQFAAGQYDVLLGEWHADRALTGAQPLRQAAGSEVPHSVKLMKQGQVSRAALHLSSAGVANPADPAVREQMCAKFPERKVGVPQRFGNVPHGALELKGDRLCEAMRLLTPLASAGPDGWRNEYLTSLVKVQDPAGAARSQVVW
jgi:hypothetical protein